MTGILPLDILLWLLVGIVGAWAVIWLIMVLIGIFVLAIDSIEDRRHRRAPKRKVRR